MPCTRAAIFFYVWQSSISVLCYGAAFIILHQGSISTERDPGSTYPKKVEYSNGIVHASLWETGWDLVIVLSRNIQE